MLVLIEPQSLSVGRGSSDRSLIALSLNLTFEGFCCLFKEGRTFVASASAIDHAFSAINAADVTCMAFVGRLLRNLTSAILRLARG